MALQSLEGLSSHHAPLTPCTALQSLNGLSSCHAFPSLAVKPFRLCNGKESEAYQLLGCLLVFHPLPDSSFQRPSSSSRGIRPRSSSFVATTAAFSIAIFSTRSRRQRRRAIASSHSFSVIFFSLLSSTFSFWTFIFFIFSFCCLSCSFLLT